MYEAPKLERFGTLRDLTLDRWTQMQGSDNQFWSSGKTTPATDPALPLGNSNDGPRS